MVYNCKKHCVACVLCKVLLFFGVSSSEITINLATQDFQLKSKSCDVFVEVSVRVCFCDLSGGELLKNQYQKCISKHDEQGSHESFQNKVKIIMCSK